VNFSQDSLILGSTCIDGTIRLFSTVNGNLLKKITVSDKWIYSITFSRDDKYFCCASGDHKAYVYVLKTKALEKTLSHNDIVESADFALKEDLLVTAGADRFIKIWKVGSWECLHEISSHLGDVNSVRFSFNSKFIISSSFDKTVKVHDAN
jgi:WD40 repeat protein